MREKHMNIALHRITAVMLRYLMIERRNYWRFIESLFWPTMDIMLWGLTSVWMAQQQVKLPQIVLVMMTCLVLWSIVQRAQLEIVMPLLEELWQRSLITLFATPLNCVEWIIGLMLNGLLKTTFIFCFGASVVWLLYALNVFAVGWMIFPYALSLMLFGWAVGFLGAAFVIYYGQKAQNVAWMLSFVFAPVSGIFYPIAVLPVWAQKVAWALPLSYAFEGMRAVIFSGVLVPEYLASSLGLSLVYLFAMIWLFAISFQRSRRLGFERL
jgi:ABC-2 type transport system permease protein